MTLSCWASSSTNSTAPDSIASAAAQSVNSKSLILGLSKRTKYYRLNTDNGPAVALGIRSVSTCPPGQRVLVMRGSILSAMRCPQGGATPWRSLIPSLPLAKMLVLGPGQAPAKTRVGGVTHGGISVRTIPASPCRLGCGPLLVVGSKWAKAGCAHCAHPGLRIGSYWCRTGPDCGGLRGSGGFTGAGTRFESHLGHVFSLFRGLLASECAQTVHLWAPSGAFLLPGRYCGRRLLLVVSGSGGAAYSFMARGAASCMTGRWLGERCCRCWFAFLDGMTVHGDVAR